MGPLLALVLAIVVFTRCRVDFCGKSSNNICKLIFNDGEDVMNRFRKTKLKGLRLFWEELISNSAKANAISKIAVACKPQ